MSNPIFNTQAFPEQFNEEKRERRRFYMDDRGVQEQPRQQTPRQGQPFAQQHGMPGRQGTQAQREQHSAEQLNQQYSLPDAAGRGAPMTYDDVIRKTLMSFVVVLVGAGVAVTAGAISFGLASALMIVGVIGGFILGLVNAFRREPNPALILAYSAFQGLFVGGISMFLEYMYPGIVIQAVAATLIVFASVLVLFKSGKVRATPKLTKMFMVAGMAYLVFALLNFGMMMFGGTSSMFGLRTEFSPWIGIGLGALAILLATYSLVLDFTNIQEGVAAGVAQKYGWAAAFGLTVSLVWLYIEILRIIAIVREMAN